MNINWGPCKICKLVLVRPLEEGGTGLCAVCTTKCRLCGRPREITGTVAHAGLFHGRYGQPPTNDNRVGHVPFWDWLCYLCISERSLLEYMSALYGADYIRLYVCGSGNGEKYSEDTHSLERAVGEQRVREADPDVDPPAAG